MRAKEFLTKQQTDMTIPHRPRALALIFCLIIGSALLSFATDSQTPDDSSRQIVLDRFNQARPPDTPTTPVGRSQRRRPNSVAVRPVYRRTSPLAKLPGRDSEELGVTVWRLRPARSDDPSARLLVLDGAKQEQWVPERIEANTPLNIGDRVRITVESPRLGYVYIVDREQYADGSFGEAMLIFPTLNTRGGDNRVEPGRLIDIPAQEDRYSYFTAQPTGERRDQVAEVLTIILVPQTLPLRITGQPLQLSPPELATWESLWSGATERLELVGGAGSSWTNEEKEAGRAAGRRLTQTAPPPQTIYRIAVKAGGPLLVNIPLRYGR